MEMYTEKQKNTIPDTLPDHIFLVGTSERVHPGCLPDKFPYRKNQKSVQKCPYRRAPCTERCAELSLHISLCIPCSPIHHPPRGTNPRSPFRVPKRCLGRPPPHPGRDRAPLKEVAFQDRAAYDPVLSRPGCAAVALLPREPKRSG